MNQRLQSMQVEYPQEEEIQMQRQLIIEKAMPRTMGKREQLRSIYWGPGLKAIFYHSQGIWSIALVGSSSVFLFATICVYAYRRCSGSTFWEIMSRGSRIQVYVIKIYEVY